MFEHSMEAISDILRYKGGTGEFIEVFVSDHEMGSSGEIIWGPDGKLYASDTTGNQVRRYWSVEDQSCSDVDNDNICDSRITASIFRTLAKLIGIMMG